MNKSDIVVVGIDEKEEKIVYDFLKWLKKQGLANKSATGFSIKVKYTDNTGKKLMETIIIPR